MPGTPRILILDHRKERGDVLRVVLGALGHVDLASVAPAEPIPDLVVVDPAAGAPLTIPARLRSVPLIVLGAEPPVGAPIARTYSGPVVPSRLRELARELLNERPPSLPARSAASAAALLPLGDRELALLTRIAATRLPVILRGEPGSGRALLTRSRLTAAGAALRRLDPSTARLRALLADVAAGSTVYVAPLELADDDDQLALLDLLDDGERDVRVVVGLSQSAEVLRDELRVRLEPLTIDLPALRRHPERLPGLFRSLLATLAEEHGQPPVQVDDSVDDVIRDHPWPLNFEEMVGAARRALFAAAGPIITAAELDLETQPAADRQAGDGGAQPARRLASIVDDSQPLATRSLDELVQELSHEVKNPLVSIKTFTELLAERFDDEEFRGEYYRIVARDIDRIDGSLAKMIEFARLRAPSTSIVDLRDIVQSVLTAQEYLFRKRSVRLRTDLPETALEIETDPELLSYALESILREALETLPEGAELEVLADRPLTDASKPMVRIRLGYRRETAVDSAPEDSQTHVRRAVGLRNALAAHVVGLLGGRQRIEDTVDGQTFIGLELDG